MSSFFRPSQDRPSLINSVLVIGSARSGTTWLGEMINSTNEFKVIFEPFSVKHNPVWERVGQQKLYLRPDDKFRHKNLMRDILAGKIDNNWSAYSGKVNTDAKRVLVKEIRASAMAGWIQKNFPELVIIQIVRDPYSVAFSCTEKGWGGNIIKLYLEQHKYVEDILNRTHLAVLERADSLFQKNLAMWCIENHLALAHMRESPNVTSVFYEHLVQRPGIELKRLYDYCGIVYDEKIQTKSKKRSLTASGKSVIDPSSSQFGLRWENSVTPADIDYAHDVLVAFGLNGLYASRNQPAYNQPFDATIT